MIKRSTHIDQQKLKITRLYHFIDQQKVSEPKQNIRQNLQNRANSRQIGTQKKIFKINENVKEYVLKKTHILFGTQTNIQIKQNHKSEKKRKQRKNIQSSSQLPLLKAMKTEITINPGVKPDQNHIRKLGNKFINKRYNSLLLVSHVEKTKQKIKFNIKREKEEKKIIVPAHKTEEHFVSRLSKVQNSDKKIIEYSAWDTKLQQPEEFVQF